MKHVILSFVALTISVGLYAQERPQPIPFYASPHAQSSVFSTKPMGIRVLPALHQTKDAQKTTATDRRCHLITHVSDGVTLDSAHFTYSLGRGSYTDTEPRDSFIYYCYTLIDTSTYFYNVDNFTAPYLNLTQVYDNDHKLLNQIYYNNNYPYDQYNQTWFPGGGAINYSDRLIKYFDNTTNSFTDYLYYTTDWNTDGWNVSDSIVFDYSQNDPSLNSNYTTVYNLFFESSGRPYFQSGLTTGTNFVVSDSMWRMYIDATSLTAQKDSFVRKTVYLPSTYDTSISVTNYTYNTAGLLDSMAVKDNGQFVSLQTYAYNAAGLITEVEDFYYNNVQWEPLTKLVYTYAGQTQIAYTTYNWDAMNNQYVEVRKIAATLNSQNMWDTVRYYTLSTLSGMMASTFTSDNYIESKTMFTYDATGTVTSTYQTNYFYDEYETSLKPEKINLQAALFPNPTSGILNLRINEAFDPFGYELTIMDMQGRLIRTQQVKDLASAIPLHSLPNGTYLIQVQNKDKSKYYAGRFVKY